MRVSGIGNRRKRKEETSVFLCQKSEVREYPPAPRMAHRKRGREHSVTDDYKDIWKAPEPPPLSSADASKVEPMREPASVPQVDPMSNRESSPSTPAPISGSSPVASRPLAPASRPSVPAPVSAPMIAAPAADPANQSSSSATPVSDSVLPNLAPSVSAPPRKSSPRASVAKLPTEPSASTPRKAPHWGAPARASIPRPSEPKSSAPARTPVVEVAPPQVSTPTANVAASSIDPERALELDALATAILKQHLATPKTLVGLGAPAASAPRNSAPSHVALEPVPPSVVPLKPAIANAALIEAALADADDDDETIVMPERRAPSHDELGVTQRHAFQPVDETPVEAALIAASTASALLEPAPPIASAANVPAPPVASAPNVPAPSQTITPPPPEDASVLDYRALPDTRRYDIAPQPAHKRDAAVDSARSRSHSDAPWAVPPARSRRAPKVGSRLALMVVAFGASLAATLVLINALLPSRKGNLLVTAAGPNQIRVDKAEVLLDGKPACAQVPCRLEGISAGAHAVTVRAPGYENMAAQPIIVRGGGDSALQLTLTRRDTAALRINSKLTNLALRVDGEDRGTAPTTLLGLPPGEHTVRLSGNPAYAPFEQRVVLEADRTLTIEPTLKALRSVLHLERGSGADDARVELVSGNDRRVLTELPANVELAPGTVYRVHASKRNFQDFDAEVRFEEGVAERSLQVTLLPRDEKSVPSERRAPSSTTTPPVALGSGTLSLNSIPISSVLLDGRPVGTTPQKLTLDAGPHSVVFVHPKLGRKESRVNVTPGKTAVAAVRF